MGEKIVIGPINKGLRNDRRPFVIDNDSFPILLNAYQWRGRIKRKRGTSLLGRLSRFLGITDGAGNITVTISPQPIISGIVSFVIGTDVFVDPGGASPVTLLTNSSAVKHTFNRTTGVLTITKSQPTTAVIYFPTLPVMGLEDLILGQQFPGTLAFDTTYSYNIVPSFPYNIYDVSFYKNPAANGTDLPFYVPKGPPSSTWTPTWWNGKDYQQFWTVNYQGALWATNGIDINPTTLANIGMQFAPASTITYVSNTPTTIVLTITNCPLVIGDFVFLNEWIGTTPAASLTLNFQSGYVTNTVGLPVNLTVTITLPFANLAAGPYTPGIVQYLTNRSDTTKDVIRWYDGDPTNGSTTNPMFVEGKGWVNFMPPISEFNFSIGDLPARQYYLVGARLIFPFKDRLLFFGVVVQASTGNPVYLEDTIVYSQNGTPYYTASFTGDPVSIDTVFHPILVPVNQTATAPAYFSDQTGFGGFITAGVDQAITTVSPNEDVLIVGFNNSLQTRLVYSGNDIVPFNFFVTNSELGSSSTFSTINMDQGVITRGNRGFIITTQVGSKRIDLEIPDEVFEIKLSDNGSERFCSQRDFINEWIYFTYSVNNINYKFPTQTLQYNYRDDSWGIFKECYTTYGSFRVSTGLTWGTVGSKFPTWGQWNVPWNSGSTNTLQPLIIAGNQQGFVFFRDQGTTEEESLAIQNISASLITSPNHCLNNGDYIIITSALGTIGPLVNNKIFSVVNPTTNSFNINPSIGSGTYLGGGVITRLYVPLIITKQFPVAWDLARKTRLGPQQYLLSTTEDAQITLLIFLSQNQEDAWNNSPVVNQPNVVNNSLIYNTVLYTCPESTNLGLTQANTSLIMNTYPSTPGQEVSILQDETWHRINTSLIGDTVQVGFTLSDTQMRTVDGDGKPVSQFEEIELHGIILDVNPSSLLA